MSVEQHTVSFDLTVDVEQAYRETLRLQRVIMGTMAQMQRMGLPENVTQAMDFIQSLIRAVNALRMAYYALQIARMAAGDPLAWAQFGITAVATAGTLYAEADRRGIEW